MDGAVVRRHPAMTRLEIFEQPQGSRVLDADLYEILLCEPEHLLKGTNHNKDNPYLPIQLGFLQQLDDIPFFQDADVLKESVLYKAIHSNLIKGLTDQVSRIVGHHCHRHLR